MHNLFLTNEMIEFIEHRWTKNPVCPHCGCEQNNDLNFGAATIHIDVECASCENDFRVWEEIDYSFSTERL